MTREILFRGFYPCSNGDTSISVDGKEYRGKWVYGYPYPSFNDKYFLTVFDKSENSLGKRINTYEALPSTVGQYTGLDDKNGGKIFEGDRLKVQSGWYGSEKPTEEDKFDLSVKGVTYWTVEHKIYNTEMGYFTFGIDRRWKRPLTRSRLWNADAKIIGTIYDNPELMGGGE